ncbi:endonuclease/exonuclease/phosphatase family protein [Desulfobulbus sp.]|uniref:endonuclease/exonuclease/phosphatase family protein n=1 Tax=Desulfobulbus sp. TaxID=895 RepID=UPI00286F0379|nr:endonuclease/exonuclease/phosphatase family protein [Desulfobulbus sp.]
MIRVMSFNIRYGLAPDGENHWHHRKHLALARIRAFGPDLLGLQECRDDEQAAFVRQGLPDLHFYGVHRQGPGDTALEMAPLLFRPAAFTLLDSGCFWLSETPEVPGSMSWDSAYARTVSWARLACRTTGRELTYVNTHLDYEPEAVVNHARCLRHWLDRIESGMPLIVTGDFNADKDSEPYRLLTGDHGLNDAFRLAHPPPGQDEVTYHAYGQEEERTSIDWILISDHFRVMEAQIDRSREGRLFPSDHYPVTAVLDWRD